MKTPRCRGFFTNELPKKKARGIAGFLARNDGPGNVSDLGFRNYSL